MLLLLLEMLLLVVLLVMLLVMLRLFELIWMMEELVAAWLWHQRLFVLAACWIEDELCLVDGLAAGLREFLDLWSG